MRFRLFAILLFFIFFVACEKEDFTISNLFGNKIVVLGHGGMGLEKGYPKNTFESISKCINLGADGSEMDVQLTKDSVLILYHSPDLSDETNIKGIVNNLTWAEIQKANYVSSSPYLKYSLISLEQLFSNINNLYDNKYTFDCKLYCTDTTDFINRYVNSLYLIIDKYNLYDNVYIESRNIVFLQKLQNKSNKFKLFYYPDDFHKGLEIALENDLYGITISQKLITKEQVEIAHKKGIYVTIWGMHTKDENIENIKKNPDFMQTDKLSHLINLLE